MTLQDRLSEIEERAEKATPGPWKLADIEQESRSRLKDKAIYRRLGEYALATVHVDKKSELFNADFIAASRTDIPKLVKALRVLDNALKCNETFHSLGGIDDCEPCLAKLKAGRILEGKHESTNE